MCCCLSFTQTGLDTMVIWYTHTCRNTDTTYVHASYNIITQLPSVSLNVPKISHRKIPSSKIVPS